MHQDFSNVDVGLFHVSSEAGGVIKISSDKDAPPICVITPATARHLIQELQRVLDAEADQQLFDTALKNLPWHRGFHRHIMEKFCDEVHTYSVYTICDRDGKHVGYAHTSEGADAIIATVNSTLAET